MKKISKLFSKGNKEHRESHFILEDNKDMWAGNVDLPFIRKKMKTSQYTEDVTLVKQDLTPQNVKCKPVTQNTRAYHSLNRQLCESKRYPVEGFSVGLVDDEDLLIWEVILYGPPNTLYKDGIFKCILEFTDAYPIVPPTLTFKSDIWHPNIDKNGKVCLSIFNQPGDDPSGYFKAEEMWLPFYTVETIMLCVISLLSEPNPESPANVDAAKQLRENYDEFKKNVLRCVRISTE